MLNSAGQYFNGLYYETFGSGKPIIVLHGFGATSYSWRYLIPHLERQYRLYVFDLKGHGKSEKPADGRYSLEAQAGLIFAFIVDQRLQEVALIGHSMGGGVAILASLRILDEGARRLSSLVLIDSISYPQPQPLFIRVLTIPLLGPFLLAAFPKRIITRRVLGCAYFDQTKIDDEDVEVYSRNIQSRAGRRAIVQVARQIIPPDITAITQRYGNIISPVLILWGDHDRIVSLKLGKRLALELKKSTFELVERCGHIPHEERFDVSIPKIVSFLSKTSSENS